MAVVLDRNVVMTTATCYDVVATIPDLRVCAGHTNAVKSGGPCASVVEAYKPREYRRDVLVEGYDLAVLLLSEPITTNWDAIRLKETVSDRGMFDPAPPPVVRAAKIGVSMPAEGSGATVVTFGGDGFMRDLGMNITKRKDCDILVAYDKIDDERIFCAHVYAPVSWKGTLRREDSGSPLVVNAASPDDAYIIGIMNVVVFNEHGSKLTLLCMQRFPLAFFLQKSQQEFSIKNFRQEEYRTLTDGSQRCFSMCSLQWTSQIATSRTHQVSSHFLPRSILVFCTKSL